MDTVSKKILPNQMKLNKIGEVWNSANRPLTDFIGLLSSKNFATMAKWSNDVTTSKLELSQRW